MSDIAITFAILLVVVIAFVSNRIPVGLVAIGAALALYFTGVLDLTQALAGFGDPAVIFIATLFVVSEGLDASGVTTWAGQQLIARVGDEPDAAHRPDDAAGRGAHRAHQRERRGRRAPAGDRRDRRPAAALALAAADAAGLRGACRVDARADRDARERHRRPRRPTTYGGRPFGFFEFALVGIPLVARDDRDRRCSSATRLLPSRKPRGLPTDFSEHARILIEQYRAR